MGCCCTKSATGMEQQQFSATTEEGTVIICLPTIWDSDAEKLSDEMMAASVASMQARNKVADAVVNEEATMFPETNPRAFMRLGTILLALPPIWQEEDKEGKEKGGIVLDSVEEMGDRIRAAFETCGATDFSASSKNAASVLYIRASVRRQDNEQMAIQLLRLCAALCDWGALGVKVESAGLAHDKVTYLNLAREVDTLCYQIQQIERRLETAGQNKASSGGGIDEVPTEIRDLNSQRQVLMYDRTKALYRAFVVNVTRRLKSDSEVMTFGMKYFGIADAVVLLSYFEELGSDNRAGYVAELLCQFACYLIHSEKSVAQGQTFSLGSGHPAFQLTLSKHPEEEDDLYHNPWGIWRLKRIGISK